MRRLWPAFDSTQPNRRMAWKRVQSFGSARTLCVSMSLHIRQLRSLAVAGAAALSTWGACLDRAHACDCSFENFIAPTAEDGQLPGDTRVWIHRHAAEGQALLEASAPGESIRPSAETLPELFAVLGPDGQPVPYGVTPIQDGAGVDIVFMLTPEQPLVPGRHVVSALPDHAELVTFSIGELPPGSAPAPPRITERHTSSDDGLQSSCGESRAEHFSFESGAGFLLAAVNLEPSTDGAVWRLSALTQEPFLSVGKTACGLIDWDFDDGPVAVSFARMDFSGRISEWSEPERIYVEAPSCSCDVVGGARRSNSTLALALVGVVLGALRLGRRR